jgi:hypothetical protein
MSFIYLLQEALPSAGALNQAAFVLQHRKRDDEGARSSQSPDVRHPLAVSPTTSLPDSALLREHASHASGVQGVFLNAAGKKGSIVHEGTDAFPAGSIVEQHKVRTRDSERTGQHPIEGHFQCLHDAEASKYRAMAQLNKEIETSIEDLASLCLDKVPGQPSDPASSESCPARLGHDPSSNREAISFAEHDGITEGEDVEDRMRWKRRRGLLGESGEAIKAVHGALKEIEDVHSSDSLMHFEFCGPFWELSEV